VITVRRERRRLVLVVEDDYGTREALVALAELVGLGVIDVLNGREALTRLRAGLRPCLIVLDMAMPDMDGLEFRRRQLADPQLAAIPVAVVSGGGSAVEADARRLGLTLFLRKPFDPERLTRLFADCAAA
jgi:CheY-like chemotaxis protein